MKKIIRQSTAKTNSGKWFTGGFVPNYCNPVSKIESRKKHLVAAFFCLVVFNIATTVRYSLNTDQVILDYFDGPTNQTEKNASRNIEETEDHQRAERLEAVNESFENDDSFSACIMWMDDNHRLEEWLAYHYYLLKLRYVVVTIDHKSRTSPQSIIDRWNDRANKYNLNMTIVVFRDHEFVADYDSKMEEIENARLLTKDQERLYGELSIAYHRSRQTQFYRACSEHLVQQNKSWTSYHDTDEFLTFDHNENDNTAIGFRKMEQPGYVLNRLNAIKKQFPPDTYLNETGLSCLIVKRRRLCAKQLNAEETKDLFLPSSDNTTGRIVPAGFMNSSIDNIPDEDRKTIVSRFDTLRYKYLTPGTDGNPKSFIDLSQRSPQLYIRDQWETSDRKKGKPHKWGVHNTMVGMCVKEAWSRLSEIKKMVNDERFVIHHYLGSFEYYSFRDDARKGGLRSYEIWKERANLTKGEFSHVIRPWLRGFVELVGGPKVASYLLQDAGKFPEDYNVASRINAYNKTYDFGKNRKRKKGR